MGIDLAGTELYNASGLVAIYGGVPIMTMGVTGILQRFNLGQPMFRAGGSGSPAEAGLGTDAWVPVVLNATNVNVGSCYSSSNGRFTVPATGIYFVTGSTYLTRYVQGGYTHPMFWVNGSSSVRRPSGPLHRIRGHGGTYGYIMDSETFEFISLIAGDYVNFYNYCGGGINNIPQYSRFEGYLLG